jgi:hypothetical protein
VDEVSRQQGEWEEQHAEDEVADEAVSLAVCDASRPERQRYPDRQEGDAD